MRIANLPRKIGLSSHSERNQLKKYTDNMGYLHSINYKENFSDWDVEDENGVSSLKYPRISPCQMITVDSLHNAKYDLFSWENHIIYRDVLTNPLILYLDDFPLPNLSVTNTEKRYAVINKNVVVFPDKIIFNIEAIYKNYRENGILFRDSITDVRTYKMYGDFVNNSNPYHVGDKIIFQTVNVAGHSPYSDKFDGEYHTIDSVSILTEGSNTFTILHFSDDAFTGAGKPSAGNVNVIRVDLNYHNLQEQRTISSAVFSGNEITVSSDLTSYFRAGDGVSITGSTNNNISFVIKSITTTKITATTENIFTSETAGNVVISRNVPDMDFIFESENRLWGCNKSNNTIYASALGDPYNFNVFEGVSTDSYSVVVASEYEFTGACKQSTNNLFWKERCLHKIVGSYPSEYTIYTYQLDGIKEGCHKSAVLMDDVLYYVGVNGVMTFTGSSSSLLSGQPFVKNQFENPCACTDGRIYYLTNYGNSIGSFYGFLYGYDKTNGLWHILNEGALACPSFIACTDSKLYIVDEMYPYLNFEMSFIEDENKMNYSVIFRKMFDYSFNKKRIHKINILLEKKTYTVSSPYFRVYIKYDDSNSFTSVYSETSINTSGPIRISIPVNRCSKYQIKIESSKDYEVLDIQREYLVGSEV